MSGRKTKKKTGTRRRSGRRVGAARSGDLQAVAVQGLIVAGVGFGVGYLANKFLPATTNKKLVAVGVAAGGLIVGTKFIKGQMGVNVALGSVVAGTTMALSAFGVLSGVSDIQSSPYRMRLNGPGVSSQVNGPGVNSMVNGPGVASMVNGNQTIATMVNGAPRSVAFSYMQ